MLLKKTIISLTLLATSHTLLGTEEAVKSRLPQGFHQQEDSKKISFFKKNLDLVYYAFEENPSFALKFIKFFIREVKATYTAEDFAGSPLTKGKLPEELTNEEVEANLESIPSLQKKIDQFSISKPYSGYFFMLAYDRICKKRGTKFLYDEYLVLEYEGSAEEYFASSEEEQMNFKQKIDANLEPKYSTFKGERFDPLSTNKMKRIYLIMITKKLFKKLEYQILSAKYIVHGKKLGF